MCKINENISRDPIEKVLDHYLNLYKEENITGLPVVSGAFGICLTISEENLR